MQEATELNFGAGAWPFRRIQENMELLARASHVLAQRMVAERNRVQTCPAAQLWLQLGWVEEEKLLDCA